MITSARTVETAHSGNVMCAQGTVQIGVIGIASQLLDPLLVALDRLGVVRAPPFNTFTALANAAMEAQVMDGSLSPYLATGFASTFKLDLIRQYYAAGASEQWLPQYCADPAHGAWCEAAAVTVAAWQQAPL